MKASNEIKYFIGEIPVRRINKAPITFGESEWVRLANAAKEHGLSIPKIIAKMCSPCSQCGNDNVTIREKVDEAVIKKNLLSTKRASSGGLGKRTPRIIK